MVALGRIRGNLGPIAGNVVLSQEHVLAKVVVTALVVIIGGCGAILYWKMPPPKRNASAGPVTQPDDERPWRRVASGIFAVVSIMFLLGVVLVDVPDHPRIYATFWAILLCMVVWLLRLAAKDLRYTSSLAIRARQARTRAESATFGADAESK